MGSKENKKWVWLALDADSREMVGVFVGHRYSAVSNKALAILASRLPPVWVLLHRFLGSV
ncbi:hypothetical protein H6F84_15855 [Microcoleus sp. FACHB-84]|nr:hypothetical protein [Microcoleus sp. FACHB-84]